MKKIMQFRFEGFQNLNNYPAFSDYNAVLTEGNIFHDYGNVYQLGIQAPPGLRFYLNNSPHPITIGKTGIYELDLGAAGRINSVKFNPLDIDFFFEQNNNRLLIDIIYEEG